MGVWQRLRGWFSDESASAPPESSPASPDYTAVEDARLDALWDARERLTEAARDALEAECLRRGLLEPDPSPKRRTSSRPSGGSAGSAAASKPAGPRPSSVVVEVRDPIGVLLETTPGRHLLVHLPRWDPTPLLLPDDLALDAIVVCNHIPAGSLDTSMIAARYGLGPEAIHAASVDGIDRRPGIVSGQACVLTGRLRLGNLRLRPLFDHGSALRATWEGSNMSVTVGVCLPSSLVGARPESRAYVGSLEPARTESRWSMMLAAAHGAALIGSAGPQLVVLGSAVGALIQDHYRGLYPGPGITVLGDPCPVDPDAVALLAAASADSSEAIDVELDDVTVVGEAFAGLVLLDRLDAATRVADAAARRHPGSPTSTLARGQLALLTGALDEGLAAATSLGDDSAGAQLLAAVHLARGDLDAACVAAERGHALAPDDPDAIITACRTLWLAGRVQEADARLAEAPFGFGAARAGDLSEMLAAAPPAKALWMRASLPGLAARAMQMARHLPPGTEQDRWLQRTRDLDPLHGVAGTRSESAS